MVRVQTWRKVTVLTAERKSFTFHLSSRKCLSCHNKLHPEKYLIPRVRDRHGRFR